MIAVAESDFKRKMRPGAELLGRTDRVIPVPEAFEFHLERHRCHHAGEGQFKCLGDRWFLPYYADVGGGGSDFTWQASAGIAFKAARWADIALVYRYLAWDIGGDVIEDIDFSGPALGVVFRF